jgi:hypothetical protein
MKKVIEVGNGNELLISDDSSWFLQTSNRLYSLQSEVPVLFILPILERSYEDFCSQVGNHENLQAFPILSILTFPFENKLSYWAALALNWMENAMLTHKLTDWASLQDRSWMPQFLEHRFKSIYGTKDFPKR